MTQLQADLLEYLRERALYSEVAPSLEEMQKALALRSKSQVCALLDRLEKIGRITRVKHQRRSIKVVGLHDYAAGLHDGMLSAFAAVFSESPAESAA